MIPTIPSNPVTKKVNQFLIDYILDKVMEKYLPNFEKISTSKGRTAEDQQRLKAKGLSPAENSAHLYNLAEDFTLKNRATGEIVGAEQLELLFTEYFQPNFPGYSEYSPAIKGLKSAHIHANLPRSITESTKFLGWAGTGIVLYLVGKKLIRG